MAKKYDGPIDKHTDFTHAGPDGEPASGLAVQNYIKDIDSRKVGVGYTLGDGSAHLMFADEEDMQAFKDDPTRIDLIKDKIEFEALYVMNVEIITPTYVPVFMGSTGNYISYTFSTTSKGGTPVIENVVATYTITHGTSTTTVTESYRSGTTVMFNMDNYITEGETNIHIVVTGQTSTASKPVDVTYQVISLKLEDTMDISTVYNMNSDANLELEIPYMVTGTGQKTIQWYIDGVLQSTDMVTTSGVPRTKFISLSLYQQGKHSVQFRAGVLVSGEMFYTETHYREFFINRGESGDVEVAVAVEFPASTGIITPLDDITIYPSQYEQFSLKIAAWNPSGRYQNTVDVVSDGTTMASVDCLTGQESVVPLTFMTDGEKTILFVVDETVVSTIVADVAETNIDIHENTDDLEFAFSGEGRTNSSSNRDSWTDGTHTATFTGFDWNDTSGWVDGNLYIRSGSTLSFDYAPLSTNPITRGKTLEFEFESTNVDDENAALCDITNASGTGIKITATEIIVKSRSNALMSRRYKSDERLRVSIVINRTTGSDARLAFVYLNGILSIATVFSSTDSYANETQLSFGGVGSDMILKQVRIYNAALPARSVLDNYILYRDTVAEMFELYDKNNLLDSGGNYDINKIAGYLPVMIITGDIPKLEDSESTSTEIIANIQYINLQDPTRSFTLTNAAMRGQGTTSMLYPKKNYRFYSKKYNDTVLRDYQGNIVQDRLYSFKGATQSQKEAQPVKCWCLKTDFAESSGTHNTGVGRLWNDVMVRAMYNGQNALRTQAQQTAITNDYQYDVRTTIDGFPIVVFYHVHEDEPLIFLGKYNFNNDKSTESVFGFTGIPGFDSTNVQCFEFLNSSNPLALFQTVEGFDSGWSAAWESRYPDTDTPNLAPLKRLATWISSTKNNLAKWVSEKADYFDMPKLAAYYIYLMRFGAVDQTVKNAMITTEDGLHWYFINYDNDTILGVRNDGALKYDPYITRQTIDPELGDYAYAGHESVLWNNFEADSECMSLVYQIDSSLYTAGLSYAGVIDMFNNKQAAKWAEVIYNSDAQYKYIGPYVNEGKGQYIVNAQGARIDHRKWWLSNRFAAYDAIFVNGAYTGNSLYLRLTNVPAETEFTVVSGKDFYYGYGENIGTVLESGVFIANNASHTFSLVTQLSYGSPLRIYAPYYLKSLDLSEFITYVSQVDLSAAYSETLGSKLKTLIMGVDDTTTDLRRNTGLAELGGIPNLVTLETLNIAGFTALTTLNLSNLVNLQTFKAYSSGLTSVTFASGAPITSIELPDTIQALVLNSLPQLNASGISLEDGYAPIYTLDIRNCPNITQNSALILNWLDNKEAADNECSVYMDNVLWENISEADMNKITEFKANGGTLELYGKATMPPIQSLSLAQLLVDTFGPNVFNPESSFYIESDPAMFIFGPEEILEGDSGDFDYILIGGQQGGTVSFEILEGSREGVTLNSETGVMTTTELANSPSVTFRIRCKYMTATTASQAQTSVIVRKRTYPASNQVSLVGKKGIVYDVEQTYTIKYAYPDEINGDMTASWALSGNLSSYVTIVSSDNDKVVLNLYSRPSGDTTTGTITCTITKTNFPSVTIATPTYEIVYVDEQYAIVSSVNPYAMEVMHGTIPPLAPDADKMTKVEAMLVDKSQLNPGYSYSDSIFYKNTNFRTKCENFDEFQYFTGVDALKYGTFYQCKKLDSIILPPTIKSIAGYAFYQCGLKQGIQLPSNVTTIDGSAFQSSGIVELTLPATILTVGSGAFMYCNSLETLVIQNPSIHLGTNVFYSCVNLEHVTLPNGLTTIPTSTFYTCGNLIDINIPDSVTTIGANAFYSCLRLPEIYIPEGVTTIGVEAYTGCSSVQSLEIPSTVTSIDYTSFRSTTGVKTVSVAAGNTTYNDGNSNCIIETATNKLIYGCRNTVIPNGVVLIGASAFYQQTSFGPEVEIPSTVTIIYGSAFRGCTALESVTGCDGITTIGSDAFNGCTSLASFHIPDTITNIGSNAFMDTLIASVNLPEGLTTIGDEAFRRTQITSLTIPASVTSIGSAIARESQALVSITIDSENEYYYGGENNCIIETTTDKLLQGCYANSTIPSGVTILGQYCFMKSGYSSVTIPDSVTTIEQYAFNGCTNLTSVSISSSSSLTTIAQAAFSGCNSLTEFYVPSTVTAIGGTCFSGCTSLATITCAATTPPSIGSGTLPGNTYLQHIYVPAASVEAYKTASNWSVYASKIEAIPTE